MYAEPRGKRITSKLQIAIVVKDEKMCICTQKIFKNKDSNESMEINTVFVLTPKQAGNVAETIGFYPKEGNVHQVDENDFKRKLKLLWIIQNL